METTGNFLTQPNRDFPLDCETLDMLQAGAALSAALGNIAGDKLILTGCGLTDHDTRRNPGLVFVKTKDYPDGEVLRWEGGNISEGMYVKLEDMAVTAQGYDYPKAYTRRTLAPGAGSENFSWADFKKPKTPEELETRVAKLEQDLAAANAAIAAGEPLGVVKMWAGKTVPEDYHLCDGAELRQADYPELYAAIGTTFNTCKNQNGTAYTTQGGSFRLPDLRGRFIAGYSDTDSEYNRKGNAGGEKRHTLTIAEMPAHTHDYDIPGYGNYDLQHWSGKSNHDKEEPDRFTTKSTGGGAAHENRPPYYVLAYIMKIK